MGSPRTKETFYTFEGDGPACLHLSTRVVDEGFHPGPVERGESLRDRIHRDSATRVSISGGTGLSSTRR